MAVRGLRTLAWHAAKIVETREESGGRGQLRKWFRHSPSHYKCTRSGELSRCCQLADGGSVQIVSPMLLQGGQ